MADLRGYVNTFDIMGPKSSQVLKGALRLVGGEDRALVQQVGADSFGGVLLC